MPTKRSRKRPAARPAFVLYAVLYDPGGRSGNVRFIIEGPFETNADAIETLKALVKNKHFSVASNQVSMISSAAFFHETIDRIRALMK